MPKAEFFRFVLLCLIGSTTWRSVSGQAMCPVVKSKVADVLLDKEDPNGPGFREVSGLAFSPTQRYNNRPIFFAVNDGGGGQRIGMFDSRTGDRLLTLSVASDFFTNRDWESLTIGSCGKSGVDRTCLYVMDAGDNEARATGGSSGRGSYHILKIREPKLGEYNDNDRIPTSRMSRLTFYYDHSSSPTNHADCEAMFLDHKGWGNDESVGDIYLATKWDRQNQFRYNRLFHIPASAWSTLLEGNVRYYSPRTIGKYDYNQYESNGGIHIMKRTWTNAEMTLDGTLIGLGNDLRTSVFLRCPGTSVWSAMANPDNRSRSCIDWSHPVNGQVETFAWTPSNNRALTIPEANNPRLGWTEFTYDARESPKVCSASLTRPPTRSPTRPPTGRPTRQPTRRPTRRPTPQPTRQPTPRPTPRPTSRPTPQPTRRPTPQPTRSPTREPTRPPTGNPTPGPTPPPTPGPTIPPTGNPTPGPTPPPTPGPTIPPTRNPTPGPTRPPSPGPTRLPTRNPTPGPTRPPSPGPTRPPTPQPSMLPTMTSAPSILPSGNPTSQPTTTEPTIEPSPTPSVAPTTAGPTRLPSIMPSSSPTTPRPTMLPTSGIFIPTDDPSSVPTDAPSFSPTGLPSNKPSAAPTDASSSSPSGSPSVATLVPSLTPTASPSLLPTAEPSAFPSRGLDETSTVSITTAEPTPTTSSVEALPRDNGDVSVQEAEKQCFGICQSGILLINPEKRVIILDDEISCSAIEKVYRDQMGTNDVCTALSIRARRAGCLCGQTQLELDLGASGDLTEAGYTAILAAVAAFLLIIFVGVRICFYKYGTEVEDTSENEKEMGLRGGGLSGFAVIQKPKRLSKSKDLRNSYTQSWTLWVQRKERESNASVDGTLDETTKGEINLGKES